MAIDPPLVTEIGPDGLLRESPVIAHTERVRHVSIDLLFIALSLLLQEAYCKLMNDFQKMIWSASSMDLLTAIWRRSTICVHEPKTVHGSNRIVVCEIRATSTIYIEENYSKIRDVERELSNLTMEMKLTSEPKKAALEHMRKKIELSTERIRFAKLKEEEAKKAWEAASKAVKDEEALKQKLCEDLNNLVQESSNSQFARLEELKRRLEALNPRKSSAFIGTAESPLATASSDASVPNATELSKSVSNQTGVESNNQKTGGDVEGRGKKKNEMQGRGKGIGAVPKNRGSGWTGAGFD
ncbi:hypothetical protein L1987_75132 [Smallanthus sonchifolius]|uniref:Uncharacterized protein n=1 Tax=Smallanthus sonchifolius TaxID=185202 RepID=A0ACB9A530_9ASTR|nr:hypothetical protein L1987_75132 [Smallanthus sonchifolius]